jgi:hypothetical protein
MITSLAARDVPVPVPVYIATVTSYLFGALMLFAGQRTAVVASLLAG